MEKINRKFLEETSKELKTQNNRMTQDPIFIVYEKIKVVTKADYEDEGYWWVNINDSCDEFDTDEELKEYFKDNHNIDIGDSSLDSNEVGFNGDEFEKVYYRKINKFISVFFTEKSALRFIEQNEHHLEEPFTYAASLHNNYEMRKIRELLITNNPKANQNKMNEEN